MFFSRARTSPARSHQHDRSRSQNAFVNYSSQPREPFAWRHGEVVTGSSVFRADGPALKPRNANADSEFTRRRKNGRKKTQPSTPTFKPIGLGEQHCGELPTAGGSGEEKTYSDDRERHCASRRGFCPFGTRSREPHV